MTAPSQLGCEAFPQRVAFERPNLVAGVAPGDLLAEFNVEILRAGSCTFARHREAVAQLQAAHRQRRAGKNVVVLAGDIEPRKEILSCILAPYCSRYFFVSFMIVNLLNRCFIQSIHTYSTWFRYT